MNAFARSSRFSRFWSRNVPFFDFFNFCPRTSISPFHVLYEPFFPNPKRPAGCENPNAFRPDEFIYRLVADTQNQGDFIHIQNVVTVVYAEGMAGVLSFAAPAFSCAHCRSSNPDNLGVTNASFVCGAYFTTSFANTQLHRIVNFREPLFAYEKSHEINIFPKYPLISTWFITFLISICHNHLVKNERRFCRKFLEIRLFLYKPLVKLKIQEILRTFL